MEVRFYSITCWLQSTGTSLHERQISLHASRKAGHCGADLWFCLDFLVLLGFSCIDHTAPLGQNRQRGDPYLKNEAWRQRLQNLDKDSHGTASASDARTRLCSRRQSQMLHCVPAVAQRTSPLLLCRLHVLCLSTVTRHASKQMQMPSRREPAGCTDCSLNDSRKAVS